MTRWGWRAQPCTAQRSGRWEDFRPSLCDVSSCQVLTIAATEPMSLLHSKPPKPTQARGKLLLLDASGGQKEASPETPGPAPKPDGPAPEASSEFLADPSSAEGDFSVDFEKIYKYLSSVSRRCHGPELSAAGEDHGQGQGWWESPCYKPRPSLTPTPLCASPEAAVVLDLLMALPEELQRLPCDALVKHMSDMYVHLTAPQPDPASEGLGPAAEDAGTSSSRQEAAGQAPPQASESTGPAEPRSPWQAAGVCPLNPFLVPLEFLGQAATPAR